MKITGIKNEDETKKTKAFINIEINDIQLKGFKLYENEEKELKLMLPSTMKRDENGEIMKTKDDRILNSHPILINPDLSNKSDLFKKLEKTVIDAYNDQSNYKEVKNENKTYQALEKDVDMPEFEKGDLKANNVFSISKDKQKNPDYQFKATCNLCVGALRINQVNLIYNTLKNDYNVIFPQYQSADKTNTSFVVPKDKETFSRIKKEVVGSYKEKVKEFTENQKKQQFENAQKQANQQSYEVQPQVAQSQSLQQ